MSHTPFSDDLNALWNGVFGHSRQQLQERQQHKEQVYIAPPSQERLAESQPPWQERMVMKEVPVVYRDRVVTEYRDREVVKEVPVIEYRDRVVETERVVEVLVEKPVIQYRDRVIAAPPPQSVTPTIRISGPPSPQSAPQVFYSEPHVIYAEPEIVHAQPIVVRQQDVRPPAPQLVYQPQVTYQPQVKYQHVTYQPQMTRVTNLNLYSAQQRKQLSREELHSRADEIFHSLNKAPSIAFSPTQPLHTAPSIAASPDQPKAPSIGADATALGARD